MIKLKDIRAKVGFSQMEVAKKLDLPISTYNQYETGKNQPSIEMLCKLADFYHCSLDELVGRETHLVNLEAIKPTKARLIEQILEMNDLQELRAEAFISGLMG